MSAAASKKSLDPYWVEVRSLVDDQLLFLLDPERFLVEIKLKGRPKELVDLRPFFEELMARRSAAAHGRVV